MSQLIKIAMIDDAGILRRLSHTLLGLSIDSSESVGSTAGVNQPASTHSSSQRFLSILDKRIATGRHYRRDDKMVSWTNTHAGCRRSFLSGRPVSLYYRIDKRKTRQQGSSAPHALLVSCRWPRLCQLCAIGYGCQPRSSC